MFFFIDFDLIFTDFRAGVIAANTHAHQVVFPFSFKAPEDVLFGKRGSYISFNAPEDRNFCE